MMKLVQLAEISAFYLCDRTWRRSTEPYVDHLIQGAGSESVILDPVLPAASLSPDQPISLETCRALANELQSCFKRATHLYRKVSLYRWVSVGQFCCSAPHHDVSGPHVLFLLQVSGSSTDDSAPDQRRMSLLLSEAFQAMRAELDALPLRTPSVLGGAGEVRTAALLEEYSLLLLQAVNRRLKHET